MTRKQLLELGYTEEQVNQLMELNGKAINKANQERDEAVQSLVTTQEELTKRDNDIAELSKNSTASEEEKAKLTQLQSEYEEYKSNANKREQEIKVNSALKLAIAKSGTVDETSLRANLNLENAELAEDGTIKGVHEQIDALRESKKFLFGETLNTGAQHGKALPKDTLQEQINKSMGIK